MRDLEEQRLAVLGGASAERTAQSALVDLLRHTREADDDPTPSAAGTDRTEEKDR